MANTLMFEVGVKEAGNQLTDLEKRLKELVSKYGTLQIKVEVDNLKTFINALNTIGKGEQLKPLLDRVDALQQSLTKINGSMGNVDLSSLKKQLNSILEIEDRIKKTSDDLKAKGVTGVQINNATATDRMLRDTQVRTLERNFGMSVEAAKQYIKTSEKAGSSSSELNQKIEQLSQSISTLSSKTFSVNMGTEFKTWAEQVQNLVAQVKELVAQMEKLHQVQGGGTNIQKDQLFEQAKAIELLKKQYDELLQKKASSQGIMPTVGIDRELENIEKRLPQEQAKFNEILAQGATVANSYAQTIQLLGTRFNHTAEQSQKLAEIIASGKLDTSNVQRGLKVGFNQASDIVNTIESVKKLKQEESKPAPQGGIFDPQKMLSLHDAIDKVINEVTRLTNAFAGIGKIEGLEAMKTSINGLQVEVGNLVSSLTKINGVMHIDKSAEEIAAYEAKIKSLKDQVTSLETTLKQASEGIKTVASGKGSEATQNQNLDTLNTQLKKAQENLAKMEGEYKRLDDAGAQNAGLKARIDILKQYIEHLEKVKTMDLSKAGALKANDVKFRSAEQADVQR